MASRGRSGHGPRSGIAGRRDRPPPARRQRRHGGPGRARRPPTAGANRRRPPRSPPAPPPRDGRRPQAPSTSAGVNRERIVVPAAPSSPGGDIESAAVRSGSPVIRPHQASSQPPRLSGVGRDVVSRLPGGQQEHAGNQVTDDDGVLFGFPLQQRPRVGHDESVGLGPPGRRPGRRASRPALPRAKAVSMGSSEVSAGPGTQRSPSRSGLRGVSAGTTPRARKRRRRPSGRRRYTTARTGSIASSLSWGPSRSPLRAGASFRPPRRSSAVLRSARGEGAGEQRAGETQRQGVAPGALAIGLACSSATAKRAAVRSSRRESVLPQPLHVDARTGPVRVKVGDVRPAAGREDVGRGRTELLDQAAEQVAVRHVVEHDQDRAGSVGQAAADVGARGAFHHPRSGWHKARRGSGSRAGPAGRRGLPLPPRRHRSDSGGSRNRQTPGQDSFPHPRRPDQDRPATGQRLAKFREVPPADQVGRGRGPGRVWASPPDGRGRGRLGGKSSWASHQGRPPPRGGPGPGTGALNWRREECLRRSTAGGSPDRPPRRTTARPARLSRGPRRRAVDTEKELASTQRGLRGLGPLVPCHAVPEPVEGRGEAVAASDRPRGCHAQEDRRRHEQALDCRPGINSWRKRTGC